MARYLLLKHYRGGLPPVNDVPMDKWTPDEVEAHIQFMRDFADRLEGTGEFVDGQALSPEGVWVRHDGESLTALVGDNGVGGAQLTTGGGLAGIEARLAAFDGTLSMASPLGGPTIVTLKVPCTLAASAAAD